MAGIYIHIPFCAKKCYYCDFYTVQSQKYQNEFIDVLLIELEQRKKYLQNEQIQTIYFGGGTPSLLSYKDIKRIENKIFDLFYVDSNVEITIEVNPDDINQNVIEGLKKTKIKRFSVGIQSFFDDDLKMMNRRHNRDEAIGSINLLQENDFKNISIDLLYGLAGSNIEKWSQNLSLFFDFDLPHLSAYHITYEPNTVFFNYLKKGKIKEINEEESLEQFMILRKKAKENYFIHYETSNFAKEGYFSRHNSQYWNDQKYLGIGPSAHSYDGISRQYNLKHLKNYMDAVRNQKKYFEREVLSNIDKYNDYIITKLRTIWGIDLADIKQNFSNTIYTFAKKNILNLMKEKKLSINNSKYVIHEEAKFIEDSIIEKLFFAE